MPLAKIDRKDILQRVDWCKRCVGYVANATNEHIANMDKYRKLERIGKGSFGAAYLAEKKGDPTGTKYVIKEIPIDPRDSTAAIREARLLGALDHPNIIASKESFVLPGRKVMCIVTEYADGGDLRQRLKRCMDAGMLHAFTAIAPCDG